MGEDIKIEYIPPLEFTPEVLEAMFGKGVTMKVMTIAEFKEIYG